MDFYTPRFSEKDEGQRAWPQNRDDVPAGTEAFCVSAASGGKAKQGPQFGPPARAGNTEFNRKWSSGMDVEGPICYVCGGVPLFGLV